MSFTPEQTKMLDAPLSRDAVKERTQGSAKVSYIEGWHAIAEANRIFGFDGWTRETVMLQETNRDLVELTGRNDTKYQQWRIGYIAKVRIEVGGVVREGTGFGSGMGKPESIGDAVEGAIKEAETDAMKRALMTFGNPFGLALYDKTQSNVVDEVTAGKVAYLAECRDRIAAYSDATELMSWWNSDEQKQARRDFGLDRDQVEALKQAVINKREALTGKIAA